MSESSPINNEQVGRYWNANAATWTELARAGYDVYRDALNTPAFLEMLPDVAGLAGLDLGCGEGHNTRRLADLGARMTGIDISGTFVRYAREAERADPSGIRYEVTDAAELPLDDASFDFTTAFMSLMDLPEVGRALAEAFRVTRPGGFLQFSITHPCFNPLHRETLQDETGHPYAVEVGDYFHRLEGKVDEWVFSATPSGVREEVEPFRVPRFTRTLGEWLNLVIGAGFRIERLAEPCPDAEVVRRYPSLQSARIVAQFLHVRARKPA